MSQYVRIWRDHLKELGRDVDAILDRRDFVYDGLDRPWVYDSAEGDLLRFVPWQPNQDLELMTFISGERTHENAS